MNKKILIGVIFIVLIVGFLSYVTWQNGNHSEDNQSSINDFFDGSYYKPLSEDSVITKEGRYISPDKTLNIEVKLINGIVAYTLFDKDNNKLFSSSSISGLSISDYQRWGIYIDSKGTIWIESSDVGLYVLKKDSSGNFYQASFGTLDANNINDIPIQIYNLLPSSLKDKFKR